MSPEECLELVQYIREECEHLHFAGVMNIGRMNHQPHISGPNPDFEVCAQLPLVVTEDSKIVHYRKALLL